MGHSERYQEVLAEIQKLSIASGRKEIPQLIAVSKKQPVDAIMELYHSGCRDFGENRVQEAFPKMESTPPDIRWHLIGTLQTKKVPKVIGRFYRIHSVDSLELAEKIAQSSSERNIVTHILLQVNISEEASKHGFEVEELQRDFEQLLALKNMVVTGLMTMAPLEATSEEIMGYFEALRNLRDRLQVQYDVSLPELSMGMSHDYKEAIACGATYLRIGTLLWES